MKILVNVDCLIPPLTGVGRYAQGVLRQLVEFDQVQDIVGISTMATYQRDELAQILSAGCGLVNLNGTAQTNKTTESKYLEMILAKLLGRFKIVLRAVPGIRTLRRKIQAAKIQMRSSRYGEYVYWEPNFLLADWNLPSVAVIHDLSHLRLPLFHPLDRLKEMTERLPVTLSKAKVLIAVSEFTAKEIELLLQPKQPVRVIHPGIDKEFFDRDEQRIKASAAKYRLPANFILALGTLEPRKNLLKLIDAHEMLEPELRQTYPLLLVGTKGWLDSDARYKIEKAESQGYLRYLGYVPQSDLPSILSQATFMAYPSLYEGFGMPIAEAFACATPVMTSNFSSMPEVAQGAALLIDPSKVESIKEGLEKMLVNPQLRDQLRQKGLTVAKNYSWQHSAQLILDALKLAQGSR